MPSLLPPNDRLRAAAEKMQPQIEKRSQLPHEGKPPTGKRNRERNSRRLEVRQLLQVQRALEALAELHESSRDPGPLSHVTTRAQVDVLLSWAYFPEGDEQRKLLRACYITTEGTFKRAAGALRELAGPLVDEKTKALEDALDEVSWQKIPGFFATPTELAVDLVLAADIRPGHKVLEPSAGIGNIADVIRERHPDCELTVIEWSYSLREILKLKGYEPHPEHDFLDHFGRYDRIVMNPPFEDHQDIQHVEHAWRQLRPGGMLVAVMPPSYRWRKGKAAEAFRTFVDNNSRWFQDHPEGTFKMSGTNVRTTTVVLNKPYEGE